MILDSQNQYSNSQVVNAATAVSTNVIDHGATPSGIGAGKEMMVFVNLEAVPTAAATTINVQTSDTENFAVATTIATKTVAVGDMVAGGKIHIPLAPDYKALRYTRLQYVPGTAVFTASGYLVPQDHQSQFYAPKAGVESI